MDRQQRAISTAASGAMCLMLDLFLLLTELVRSSVRTVGARKTTAEREPREKSSKLRRDESSQQN
jgi:hypothetical protein